jgi:Flp pilus assembly protein TadG
MLVSKLRAQRRRGAAAVETAMIMIPLTMLLFGVFEYGRLLLDLNVLNNAAREGCRYAVVNNTSASVAANTQAVVTNFMAGRDAYFGGFAVTLSGTHQGAAAPVNSLVAGDMLTVTVTGTYKFMNIIPLVPSLPSFTLSSSVTMACEGVS